MTRRTGGEKKEDKLREIIILQSFLSVLLYHYNLSCLRNIVSLSLAFIALGYPTYVVQILIHTQAKLIPKVEKIRSLRKSNLSQWQGVNRTEQIPGRDRNQTQDSLAK